MCCIVPIIALSLSRQTKSNMKFTLFIKFILLLIFLKISVLADAQPQMHPQANKELYKEIAHMDSVLFKAFNAMDLEKLKTLFDTDLEFYHDMGGLMNYTQNIVATKKLFDRNNGLRRELVAGTLEVYPIKDYGAIQTGSHQFCHPENGKPDCGIFKFVHIWHKKNGEWKLTRVISYGH